MRPVVATTERLILRRLEPDDAVALQDVFCNPDVMRFSEGLRSPQWVRQWIERSAAAHDIDGISRWAVTLRDSGAVIGFCGLSRRPERCGPDETELGFRLAAASWGRGLATEAASAARNVAFDELRLPKLIAMVDPANTASVRVLEKLGMRPEREAMFDGYTHPDVVYALERSVPH